ncbi:MAG: hypothetical protein ACM3ZQ_05825 [Bacillota bacterium]
MAKTIVGVFHSFDRAERAVAELRTNGFMKNEISIVAQDQGKGQGQRQEQGQGQSKWRDNASAVMNNDVGRGAGVGMIGDVNPGGTGLGMTAGSGAMTGATGMAANGGAMTGSGGAYGDQNISDGVTTGAVIGGAAGLLAGLGALAVPGVGPLLAAGPIAAALTGGITGGLAGGLIDYGIPESESQRYQSQVKQGNIVAVIKANGEKVDQVAEVFRRHGASEVNTY